MNDVEQFEVYKRARLAKMNLMTATISTDTAREIIDGITFPGGMAEYFGLVDSAERQMAQAIELLESIIDQLYRPGYDDVGQRLVEDEPGEG